MILPLPMEPLLLPLHMAWGAVVAVLVALAWNRIWFDYPAPEDEGCSTCLGFHQNRMETLGLGLSVLGAVLMCLRPLSRSAVPSRSWRHISGRSCAHASALRRGQPGFRVESG